MKKVVSPIMKKTSGGRGYRVHIKIEYNEGRLSITGVEGALPSGNCLGGCGQIDMHLKDEKPRTWKFIDGWTFDMMEKLLDVWDRWHMNDLRSGTPRQEEFVREWKAEGNKYDYKEVCKALEDAGLLIDGDHKYGHGWLKEDVPQDVIDWLFNLPDASVKCAWSSYR